MAPHSSTLAWKIPWMEEPGRLQSMGSRRVGHDWVTSLSHIGEGDGNPLQCSCLENPKDGGAWWAAIYGVTQSRTWLKQLSSSSSMESIRGLDHGPFLFCRCFLSIHSWPGSAQDTEWVEKGSPFHGCLNFHSKETLEVHFLLPHCVQSYHTSVYAQSIKGRMAELFC